MVLAACSTAIYAFILFLHAWTSMHLLFAPRRYRFLFYFSTARGNGWIWMASQLFQVRNFRRRLDTGNIGSSESDTRFALYLLGPVWWSA